MPEVEASATDDRVSPSRSVAAPGEGELADEFVAVGSGLDQSDPSFLTESVNPNYSRVA